MTTQSLTRQFATAYAEGVVPAVMKTITNSKWKTRAIMTGVFAVTYKHQADFLSADPSIGVLGWAIPGINDLAMLTMVEILQTPAMSKPAKRGAAWMLGLCGGLSAAVNVAAPGTILARVIFGVLVAIVVGLKLVTARIKPDFAELEVQESEAAAVVTPVAVGATLEPRKCADDCTCKRHPRNRKPKTAAKPRAPRQRKPAAAPVSPAPWTEPGEMVSGLWVPASAKQ